VSTHTPELIPRDVRARLRDLRLASRKRSGGTGFGLHHSRSRGAGLEFSQYRSYQQGDDPRQIDWKLHGRSDRYFVREAERDSTLEVWALVDATASMGQYDAGRPKFSRLDAARGIAACVIELALRQGDRFGLVTVRGDGVEIVPASSGARQRSHCLLQLLRARPEGAWPDSAQLQAIGERIGPGALVLVLGDLFDEPCVALAEQLSAARREVLTVQILTTEERDFPFRGGHRFKDPETGRELQGDGALSRSGFLERFAAARSALSSRLTRAGVRHTQYMLDEPLDAPLRKLFGQVAAGAAAEIP
jgi:uncharacterized protein (DUF58 family)